MNELPSVSIVIPVYNSEKVLADCLQSIREQVYPQDKIEIIVVDGGSKDKSTEIARKFNVNRILPNPLNTGEAGKAVGVKVASSEIVALIDSDNILESRDWLEKMVQPFEDSEIVASEPLYYTYRRRDGYITRYCALLGMNDPLCLFLGNYDRYSLLTQRWTEVPYSAEDKGTCLKIELDKRSLPTIGANGFLIRRSALEECNVADYLFDIDVVQQLLSASKDPAPPKFAKVKVGIVHIFSGSVWTFARKQRRRVRDYLYYEKLGLRKYPWKGTSRTKLLTFILYCLAVFPLLIQSIRGYAAKPDKAWFFHPLASWITLWEYGRGRIGAIFGAKKFRRERWRQ